MTSFFLLQAQSHPAMQPQDALKMAYQAAFGAEHLIPDPEKARGFLYRELSSCLAATSQPLWEALSEDVLRINLPPWKAMGLPAEGLLRLFLSSCRPRPGGKERFSRILEEIDRLASSGQMPFSSEDWQREKREYLSAGVRPVHHSDRYRSAEQPYYRVAGGRYARLLMLLEACGGKGIAALDGRSASGKSTLAKEAAGIAGAAVVHMDDFFLPPELRTEKRLEEPGGNVHYERFIAEVLPYLGKGKAFSYPAFDCSAMRLGEMRQVRASALTIVEGAYSCHPAFGDYMTLRIFSDIGPETRQERILLRDGEEGWQRFRSRWIPMEEKYFSAFGIREKADLILPARSDLSASIRYRLRYR